MGSTKPNTVSLHEPQTVCKSGNNPDMEKSIKAVLARNLELLMKRHERYSTNNKLADAAGLGLGTINRIRQQASAAGIDTVDTIAAKFGLKASDLLDENLEQRLNAQTSTRYTAPAAEPQYAAHEEHAEHAVSAQDPIGKLSQSAREALLRGSLTTQTIEAFTQAFQLLPSPKPALKAETGGMRTMLSQVQEQQPPQ